MNKLIILDRDGTINADRDDYVKSPEEWQPLPRSLEAIARMNHAGWRVVIASNQSGLGRGLFTMEDLNDMHSKLHHLVEEAGGSIAAITYCPHIPDDNCSCRKPKFGMIEDICERFSYDDIENLVMIGDSLRDLQAIASFGGIPILVKTGNGKKTLAREELPFGTIVFDNLMAASEYVIEHFAKEGQSEE